ncbi:MAG: RNA methyltransferase PUA domain-containing protein [Candidatus Hydrogenedentales bacterium]
MAPAHRFSPKRTSYRAWWPARPAPKPHHALHVLRVQPGQAVGLFNGLGREPQALVRDASRRDMTIDITGERKVQPEI